MKNKKNLIGLIVGLFFSVAAFGADAEEKVVWCPQSGIGKTETWNIKANAELVDNLLRINLKEDEWSGIGLNFEGFWPEDAGVKAENYKFLLIELKAVGDGKNNLEIGLRDNKNKESARLKLVNYSETNMIPEEITKFKIPISDFLSNESKLETGVIWEIIIGAWFDAAKDINVYLSKIAFINE